MIVGNPLVFAIESQLTQAYERLSLRALGSFTILIAGRRYGVFKPDATMLAASYDEVRRRIDNRGSHSPPFTQGDPRAIAGAFRAAIYGEIYGKRYPGMSLEQFSESTRLTRITWAPDGDEAFDDGSYILQLDSGNQVRLLAFSTGETEHYDPATLTDLWLESDQFYGVLSRWSADFLAEWESSTKAKG